MMGAHTVTVDEEVLNVITTVSGALSVVGAMFIVMSYVLFKPLRTPARSLLATLSFCDLVMSAAMLLPYHGPGALCDVQAILGIFFSSSSFFWSAAISVYLYVVIDRMEAADSARVLRLFKWPCVLYPAAGTIIAYCFTTFGPSNERWCFIPDTAPHSGLMRLVTVYGPLWLCLLVSCVMFLRVFALIRSRGLHRLRSSDKRAMERHRAMVELERKLIGIPVCFVVLRFPGSFNRVHTMITGLEPAATMTYLQAAMDPLQGLVNAVFFGWMTGRVRQAYAELFARCWRCVGCRPCCGYCHVSNDGELDRLVYTSSEGDTATQPTYSASSAVAGPR